MRLDSGNRTNDRKPEVLTAIGNFDGVHIGHQYLLSQVAEAAEKENLTPAVVLFDPHPHRYFQPDALPFMLTTPNRRDALLAENGIKVVHALAFCQELASLSAEDFVTKILHKDLNVKGIIVGEDFRFGKGRAGDISMLKSIGGELGIRVNNAKLLSVENSPLQKIGSTGIREAIQRGAIKDAAAMLGRNWDISAMVISGQKLGRTIGFPTANLELGALIAPRHGVYAVIATINGDQFNGIANFGRKPTVGESDPLLEVHLFDFDADIYGNELYVEFVDFIREERKFDGIEALKAQISRDCELVRALFA